jgi:preprotein translocase subunit SecE
MNSKVERSKTVAGSSTGDVAKYVLAGALVVAGLVAWWWFAGQWATPLRALAVVAGLVLAAVVFLGTAKGRDTREFLVESRFELRKVVWPTRQEALRMTWIVAIVVVVMSLLLGGFDWMIQAALKLFFTIGR